MVSLKGCPNSWYRHVDSWVTAAEMGLDLLPFSKEETGRKKWNRTSASSSLNIHWLEKCMKFLGQEGAITWLHGSVWNMKSAFPKGTLVVGHILHKNVSSFSRDLFCVCRKTRGIWLMVCGCLFSLHFWLSCWLSPQVWCYSFLWSA